MTIKRIKTCTLCNTEFTTPYQRTKYCESCRTTANKKKKVDRRLTVAQSRIQRLSTSGEWLWVAIACKRAGTVEILQGVDFKALFALRKNHNKTYGYNRETKTSKYNLCHISPAVGKETVGLLHHLNFFIGSAFHNRVHSNKSYQDKGLCIPKSKLKAKWKVTSTTSDRAVLDKVTEFLGQVLIDYTKENPVNKSQTISIAKWIFQNDPDNTLPLSELERMSISDLRSIKTRLQEKEKEVYSVDYATKRSFIVMLEECQRLSEQLPDSQHKSDIAFMIPVLQVAIAFLSLQPDQPGLSSILAKPYAVVWNPLELREGMNVSRFRDFIGFQTFHTLQGAPVDRKMIKNTLSLYFTVTSMSPDYSASNSSMQSHYADEYSRFAKQVPVIKNAIISLGLPDKVMLAEELLKAEIARREEEIFANFNYEQCEGPLDYSTIHYEIDGEIDKDDCGIDDDYILPPPLAPFQEPVFCDF
jgi:hypothetical protein